MVSEKRIERKLAAVLVDQPATTREGSIEYKRTEREIRKLKRKNPVRYRNLFFNLIQAVVAFDREITQQTRKEIDEFNEAYRIKARARAS